VSQQLFVQAAKLIEAGSALIALAGVGAGINMVFMRVCVGILVAALREPAQVCG
jgi:hypothetical protein